MAVYDSDATATTAVTALLAQFTFSANGNIRYSTGTDTFHVKWLHASLHKIVYDLAISGDDELNLSKPNPSTSEALGTIITLQDHTTAYSVNYNVTATEMEYFFGGSVEQNGGDDRWSGLNVIGSVNNASTELQIIQNGALLTSHWGTGKNQTDTATLLRIMVQTISSGSSIDGGRIVVKANEWGDTYAVWRTTLGLGEGIAAINTSSDPANDTAVGTVGAYTGITKVEGYQLIDIGTGGNKPYYIKWDRDTNSKKQMFEYIKWIMRRGTAETMFGLDADLFTGGMTFEANIDTGGAGTWVQNETVSWTEATVSSTGILLAVDNTTDTSATKIWIHLITGILPTDGTVLSGATASNAVNVTVTSLIPAANHVGQYTGSWIFAYGVGATPDELTNTDSLLPLGESTPINPPNNVTVSVTVNGTVNGHVLLGRKDGVTGGLDLTEYTAAAGNNSGNGTFVIAESIASDTPTSGNILVLEGTTFEHIAYTSWSGSTFTLSGTLGQNYTAGKDVIVPFLYEEVSADGGTASTTLVYNADIDVVGWVRYGVPSDPHKPVPISGTIGTSGFTTSVQLESE